MMKLQEKKMFELPQNTLLGKVSLQCVIEYYDFPRTFTCANSTGQNYIVISTYDDDDEYHWLYLPISNLRKKEILCGRLPLKSAILNPEGGYLFFVKTYNGDTKKPQIEPLFPEQISDDDLPSSDYIINVNNYAENVESIINPLEAAIATYRETFNYHIFTNQVNRHEIPARRLGSILTSTQELLDALGQVHDSGPTTRGSISKETLNKTQMDVAMVFPSSFGIQLRAKHFNDLIGDSTLSSALQEFSNILTDGDSAISLSDRLHKLKGRVTSKYLLLLKELKDIGSGLVFDWGGLTKNTGGRFELTYEQVKNAYEVVSRIEIDKADEIKIKGILIGYHSRTKRYEIQAVDESRSYAGKIADDAYIEVSKPTIGNIYVAHLRMLIETQSTSGDEVVRWELTGLAHTAEK